MKKIFNLLFITLAVILYPGCTPEEDDIFEDSSANRIEAALKADKEILVSATNGWLMEYYPASAQTYGGYNILALFKEDGKVTLASDVFEPNKVATSTFSMIQSAGPIVSLDTYNEIMHFFCNPKNPAGIGNDGKGMEGDFEFRIMEASKDKIVLQGRKTLSKIIMTPLAQNVVWATHLQNLQKAEEDMSFGTYRYQAGDVTATVSVSYRNFSMEYVKNGAKVTEKVPYIVTPVGYKFYQPIEIGGVTAQEFTFNSSTNEFISTDQKAKLTGVIPPVNQALISGNWFFAYSKLSAGNQAKWDIAKASLLSQEGEELIYLYYSSGKTLIFNSGGYIGKITCEYTLEGENQIKVVLKAFDTYANYYYKAVPNFPNFVNLLNSTFTLTTDDLRNPTWIKLEDTLNLGNSFTLSKTPIYYPCDN